MRINDYTTQDIRFIKENANMPLKRIAASLGRDANALRMFLGRNGIRLRDYREKKDNMKTLSSRPKQLTVVAKIENLISKYRRMLTDDNKLILLDVIEDLKVITKRKAEL